MTTWTPKSRFFSLPSPRSLLVLLFTLAAIIGMAAGSCAIWDPEIVNFEWAVSPRAQSSSFCPEGRICIEWCRVYQGHIEEATGRLCCGTGSMIGSSNPMCPN